MRASKIVTIASTLLAAACAGGGDGEPSGETASAIEGENKIHFGTCFKADKSGIQLQWYRDQQRLKVHGLPAGEAESESDFDRSTDKLIDEKLDHYSLRSDARVARDKRADFAWTTDYDLDDGKTVTVEGAWDREPGDGYPEKFGRITLRGNGNEVVYECKRSSLRRPQVVTVVPERLLLPAKDDRVRFVVRSNELERGEWKARGYVMPRKIERVSASGQVTEVELRRD